jgi:hypothetical protein
LATSGSAIKDRTFSEALNRVAAKLLATDSPVAGKAGRKHLGCTDVVLIDFLIAMLQNTRLTAIPCDTGIK